MNEILVQLVNRTELRLGDTVRPPEIEKSSSFSPGALGLAPLDVLEDGVDLLLGSVVWSWFCGVRQDSRKGSLVGISASADMAAV